MLPHCIFAEFSDGPRGGNLACDAISAKSARSVNDGAYVYNEYWIWSINIVGFASEQDSMRIGWGVSTNQRNCKM